MICRRCGSENPDSSVYCAGCGKPIFVRPQRPKKKIPWHLAGGGLVILAVAAIVVYLVITRNRTPSPPAGTEKEEAPAAAAVSTKKNAEPLIKGSIVIKDPQDVEISELESAICESMWIAVPLWSLFGAGSAGFQSEGSAVSPIAKGFWSRDDPVILCQIEAQSARITPGLAAWRQPAPLEWHSLLPEKGVLLIKVISPKRRGSILSFSLPEEVRGPGVLMQEGKIVGWTFGGETDRGFLWSGSGGEGLVADTPLERFCSLILPSFRQEQFYRAIAMGDRGPALERLEAFSSGFRKASALADEDLPPEFRTHFAVGQMHSLASNLIKGGQAKDVMRALDESVILGDPEFVLVKDSILAQAKSRDYSKAIDSLVKFKKSISDKTGQTPQALDVFHAQLYKDWLREIANKGSFYSGAVASEEAERAFPDDMEIHLLAVEVAVADQNWLRARQLLQAKNYPQDLKDWADRLDRIIKAGEEGKETIELQFFPGEAHIFIEAKINDLRVLKFIVDTGAEMTSIPSSAVEALGIRIDEKTPVRMISTASGVGITYEVALESIELNKRRFPDIKALVIDIPAYPDYGLLGQNFLNNFRIEIDNKKGILRLRKK